jgi:hypothetical protein
MILHPAAYDVDNKIVLAINAVKHQEYKCLTCGGRMCLAGGEDSRIRVHFRHIDPGKEHSFNRETFLHEYTKQRIQQQMKQSERYMIGFNVEKTCGKELCGFDNRIYCKQREMYWWDLKECGYDIIRVEEKTKDGKEYDRFRSDVLLERSKCSSDPIFIEVKVTHPCSTEKKNSGVRIIEIEIPLDYDVEEHPLNFDRLVEGDMGNGITVRFYNFKNRNRKTSESLDKKEIKAIVWKDDGSVVYLFHNQSCSKYGTRIWRGSKREIHFAIDYSDKAPVLAMKAVAALHGIPCKNCRFCSVEKQEYGRYRKKRFCNVTGEDIGYGDLAEKCEHYSFSTEEPINILSAFSYIKYVVVNADGSVEKPNI